MFQRAALACSVLLLAGCSAVAPSKPKLADVSDELVRVGNRLLATAGTGEDAREALRDAVRAKPGQQNVLLAGHWFSISHATLDPLVQGETPLAASGRLVSQSLEVAEGGCLAFDAAATGNWKFTPPVNGLHTMSAIARGRQFVSVGIVLDGQCVKALSVEQAGPRS